MGSAHFVGLLEFTGRVFCILNFCHLSLFRISDFEFRI